MKKTIALLFAAAFTLSFAACVSSGAQGSNTNVTKEDPVVFAQASESVESSATETMDNSNDPGFIFTYNGVEIAMHADAADILTQLGEPKSYTEEASCAFDGLDKTYYFGSFYLQTYPKGDNDFVYCVWLVDDSVETAEGIYIGATQAEVANAYGAECFNGSNAFILSSGMTTLTIILTDGTVSSIQYDAAIE